MRTRVAETVRRGLAGVAVGLALAGNLAAAEAGPPSAPAGAERAEPQQAPGYWDWPETTCPFAGCTPW